MIVSHLSSELRRRWDKVRTLLSESHAEGLLVSTNVNLLYLSGRVFSGYIYISLSENPIFFVKRPVGLAGGNVVYIRKPEDIIPALLERGIHIPRLLALETDQTCYSEIVRLAAAFGNPTLENGTSILKKARMIKSPFEIEELKRAGEIHCEAYARTSQLFKPGMTDIEFTIEVERLFRQLGSLGAVRIFGQSMEIHMGSVLAGSNAETPSPYDFAMGGGGLSESLPVSCNRTEIKEGMAIMVDIAGSFSSNMTDMTRVYRYGRLSDLAYKAHQVCRDIEAEINIIAKPGVACCDLYNTAAKMAADADLSDYFMGTKQQAGFVGHGIGLELNELPVLAPRSRDLLEVGMTFAFEPKMVIPRVGAVGLENSYVVTQTGIECVTPLSTELIEL